MLRANDDTIVVGTMDSLDEAADPAGSTKHGEPRRGSTEKASKRSRYVNRACQECQKRKVRVSLELLRYIADLNYVKCTGEQPGPCQNCESVGSQCVYRNGPRKRRRTQAEMTSARQ